MGDFFASAASMYQYCVTNQIRFFIDITNPVGGYFAYTRYEGAIGAPQRIQDTTLLRTILNGNDSHMLQTTIITDEADLVSKLYSMRSLIVPTAATRAAHDALLAAHGLERRKYYCIHIRFGDTVFFNNSTFDRRLVRSKKTLDERIQQSLNAMSDPTLPVVLVTDNYDAKLELSEKYTFRCFTIRPVHTTYTKDADAVGGTVLEFLTLSDAKEVFAVSWSRFSHSAAAYGGISHTCVQ